MKDFSQRNNIEKPEVPISVRMNAPQELRGYLFLLLQKFDIKLRAIRDMVCFVSKQAPDINNWGENDFMRSEIQSVICSCDWYYIYDIIEAFDAKLTSESEIAFADHINAFFIQKGIGWQLTDGNIIIRGDGSFEAAINNTKEVLFQSGLKTSSKEIKEAISDISKKPMSDITGAIQHSLAALECVCREYTMDRTDTLGSIISKHHDVFPKPLDIVVEKMWGFSSEVGRHLKEGNSPEFEEAQLMVHLAASMCTYLSFKLPKQK